jgi:hypothetical protein
MINYRFLAVAILALCTLACTLAGCGAFTSKGKIKGKVLYNGEPLLSGMVTFVGSDGTSKSVAISSEGIYEVKDVAMGPAKIAVVSGPAVPKGFDNLPNPPGGGPAVPPPPENILKIPAIYNDPEKSTLTYTVTSGEQTHIIELTP